MEERRETNRVELNHPITLRVDKLQLSAVLVNLSPQGALVSIDQAESDRIDSSVLGLDASFMIKPKDKPTRTYTGELIRFYFRDNVPYVALRFWTPYDEA